jgi:hypothetical protein
MPLPPGQANWQRVVLASVAALLSVLIVACTSGESADPFGSFGETLVRYVRVWPDGLTEEQAIASDGRVLMKHGDRLERLTLAAEDVDRLREALEATIPIGSADDQPQRTLILADGTVIDAPRPAPGTITELMDRLMDTHRL